jgi:hypothetical protein
MMPGIEHRLAADESIAQVPARLHRRHVDHQLDAAGLRDRIVGDVAAGTGDAAALRPQAELADFELG